MKHIHCKKITITLLSLCIINNLQAFDLYGTSFFNPRSQSTNAARDLVGWHSLINEYNNSDVYGACAITPAFGQILRQKNAAKAMFSTDFLHISGSLVPDRNDNDILADYFGLSPLFESDVVLLPFVRTALVDFALYVAWHTDFYFRVHAPVVWTRWQLGVQEIVETDGVSTPYPANYMSLDPLTAPYTSFGCAVQGGGQGFGDVQPLRNGKFNVIRMLAGLSDMQFALGYNIVNRRNGFAGLNLRCSAPTGSRPDSEFLFEPIVGNGKHWEIGVGFSGKLVLWEKDGNQEISFFADMNVMHLCRARQRRSFDFIVNGFGSRYILAKQFDDAGDYTRVSLPAINITTLNIDVRNSLQIDLALMVGCTHKEYLFDFGYNLWFRSHDIIDLKQCIPTHRYALKGIQNVTTMLGSPSIATQSNATLNGNYLADQMLVADPNPPVYIQMSDLDVTSAASPRVLTNKVFAHIGWVGKDHCTAWGIPYVGIGGELEFEGINPRFTILPSNNTLSQWSIWIKGGFGF